MENKRRGIPKKEEPVEKTEIASKEAVEIFVIKQCPNRIWLKGTTRDHVLAYVKAPKESIAASLVGKWVKGTKIDEEGENHYKFFA
jgi:hypothetical protein